MAPGDRSEDTPIARQFLLGQRCPDPPQRGRELVQGHRVPDGQFPAGPVVFGKPPAHLAGIDAQVGPETPAVDQGCASLQLAQVLDRAAGQEEDGADLEEAAALELEVIGHRFGRPVGLHLRNRDIAEYRVPVDACLLIGLCEVIENHRAADDARDACRSIVLSRIEGVPVRCLDPHHASGFRRRLHLICRAELQQARYPLRAYDPPVPLVAQRPGAVPQATVFGYQ
jgi:hypothetical protein